VNDVATIFRINEEIAVSPVTSVDEETGRIHFQPADGRLIFPTPRQVGAVIGDLTRKYCVNIDEVRLSTRFGSLCLEHFAISGPIGKNGQKMRWPVLDAEVFVSVAESIEALIRGDPNSPASSESLFKRQVGLSYDVTITVRQADQTSVATLRDSLLRGVDGAKVGRHSAIDVTWAGPDATVIVRGINAARLLESESRLVAPETRTARAPVVDPALVGKWEGRARDYGLFDRVRFDIREDGRFDVWIRGEHRPYLLEASAGRWRVRSTTSDFTRSGTYDLKKDGRVVWWGMFATAPIMKRRP
jgi:hypothetical protein